mmetsp:Transcript_8448/g.23505  ORF Transcript_8448/g.23505 Transcript_8448/m.23505 type:complete len:119 (+) Transcript_8448:1563-1919(+)
MVVLSDLATSWQTIAKIRVLIVPCGSLTSWSVQRSMSRRATGVSRDTEAPVASRPEDGHRCTHKMQCRTSRRQRARSAEEGPCSPREDHSGRLEMYGAVDRHLSGRTGGVIAEEMRRL